MWRLGASIAICWLLSAGSTIAADLERVAGTYRIIEGTASIGTVTIHAGPSPAIATFRLSLDDEDGAKKVIRLTLYNADENGKLRVERLESTEPRLRARQGRATVTAEEIRMEFISQNADGTARILHEVWRLQEDSFVELETRAGNTASSIRRIAVARAVRQ